MDAISLITLLLLVALASYIQTLTGFALGLIFMGGIGLTGVLPLADGAILVSIFGLVNAAQMLPQGWRLIAWREFFLVLFPGFLFLFFGYWLLDLMLDTSLEGLKLLLGLLIITSSLQLLHRPTYLKKRSQAGSFVFFGALAGIMGGLFSTAGPPLVYHFYRQPLSAAVIRETLVLIFALIGLLRLYLVVIGGDMPLGSSLWGLVCIPAVMLFTALARRFPPPLDPENMRRLAFILLFASGLSLGLPAFFHLL